MISNLINLYGLSEATEASYESLSDLIKEGFNSDCGFCRQSCKCEAHENFYVKLGDSGIFHVCLEVYDSSLDKGIKDIILYGFVAHTYLNMDDWYSKDYLYIVSSLDKLFGSKIPTDIFPEKYISYTFGHVFLTHIPIIERKFHIDSGVIS